MVLVRLFAQSFLAVANNYLVSWNKGLLKPARALEDYMYLGDQRSLRIGIPESGAAAPDFGG